MDFFFWLCLTLVLVAAFVDWLLRPHERRRVKAAVYLFWESVKDKNLVEAVRYFVLKVLKVLTPLQTNLLPSKRYMLVSALLSVLMIAVIIHHVLFDANMRQFFDMHWNFAVAVTLPYLAFTLLFCFISLMITVFFLRRMAMALHLQRIVALSALDIAIALFVGYAAYALAYFFAQWFVDVFLRFFGWTVEVPLMKYWINVLNVSRNFIFEARASSVAWMMLAFSFLPSLIYVSVVLVGILLFALETTLRPISLRFCEALLRSKNGIITVVAGGVGGIAKSIQELIKAI